MITYLNEEINKWQLGVRLTSEPQLPSSSSSSSSAVLVGGSKSNSQQINTVTPPYNYSAKYNRGGSSSGVGGGSSSGVGGGSSYVTNVMSYGIASPDDDYMIQHKYNQHQTTTSAVVSSSSSSSSSLLSSMKLEYSPSSNNTSNHHQYGRSSNIIGTNNNIIGTNTTRGGSSDGTGDGLEEIYLKGAIVFHLYISSFNQSIYLSV